MFERKTDSLMDNFFNDIDTEDYFMEGEVDTFFGQLIGLGAFTAVFNVSYPYYNQFDLDQDKDYVLMITSEKHKKDIIQAVIPNISIVSLNFEKEKQEALNNWLEENEFQTEEEANEEGYEFDWFEEAGEFNLFPFLEWILEEGGFDIFFIERVEGASELSGLVDDIDDAAFYARLYLHTKSEWSTYDQEEEEVEKFIQEKLDNPEIELSEEAVKFIKIFIRDSLEVHGICPGNLDLHGEQIVRFKGEYYCIDPFTYV